MLAEAERLGLDIEVVRLEDCTRTAEDAARACDVPVGAIVKSLVFEVAGQPVLALLAGDRRCDLGALPAGLALEGSAKRCDAERVRTVTGFAIGEAVGGQGRLDPLDRGAGARAHGGSGIAWPIAGTS